MWTSLYFIFLLLMLLPELLHILVCKDCIILFLLLKKL